MALKIKHAEELKELKAKYDQAVDQRDSLLSTNEDLHDRMTQLQQTLTKLKEELTA